MHKEQGRAKHTQRVSVVRQWIQGSQNGTKFMWKWEPSWWMKQTFVREIRGKTEQPGLGGWEEKETLPTNTMTNHKVSYWGMDLKKRHGKDYCVRIAWLLDCSSSDARFLRTVPSCWFRDNETLSVSLCSNALKGCVFFVKMRRFAQTTWRLCQSAVTVWSSQSLSLFSSFEKLACLRSWMSLHEDCCNYRTECDHLIRYLNIIRDLYNPWIYKSTWTLLISDTEVCVHVTM